MMPVLLDPEARLFEEVKPPLTELEAVVEANRCLEFEVDDGAWRLTYRPAEKQPVEPWLRSQKRFAHLFTRDRALPRGPDESCPRGRFQFDEIQRRVDAEWSALLERCGG